MYQPGTGQIAHAINGTARLSLAASSFLIATSGGAVINNGLTVDSGGAVVSAGGIQVTGGLVSNRNVTSLNTPALSASSTNAYTTNWNAISFFRQGTTLGHIQVASAAGAPTLVSASDYRLKKNIQDATIDFTKVIKELRPVTFEWNDSNMGTGLVHGFIAHEVQEIIPRAVTGSKDEVDENGDIIPQTLTEQPFVYYLVGALKEALNEIDNLKSRIEFLEKGNKNE